jgi:hypothetical protein
MPIIIVPKNFRLSELSIKNSLVVKANQINITRQENYSLVDLNARKI